MSGNSKYNIYKKLPIKNKIKTFLERYNKSLHENTKKLLNFNYKKNIKISRSYSVKKITNHISSDQDVYDYIMKYTIKKATILLSLDNSIFIDALDKLFSDNSKEKYFSGIIYNIKNIINDTKYNINKGYFQKLIYIFFYYLGLKRSFIEFIKFNYKNWNTEKGFFNFRNTFKYYMNSEFKYDKYKFGLIDKSFFEIKIKKDYLDKVKNILINYPLEDSSESLCGMSHSFLMKRLFYNYYQRLYNNITHIINSIDNKDIMNIYYKVFSSDDKYYLCPYILIFFNIDINNMPDVEILIDKKHIKNIFLRIELPFIFNIENKNIDILKNKKTNSKKNLLYKNLKLNIIENLEKFLCPKIIDERNNIRIQKISESPSPSSSLGNVSTKLESRIYFLNIMSQILEELDKLKKLKLNISIHSKLIKKYILMFYYIFIMLMPFHGGTASIAEMALYSLWEYYLEEDLFLNQNIMLDVEVLTLPFHLFYNNFFEKDSFNDEYTPYYDNNKSKPIIMSISKLNNINLYPKSHS